jgi:hypothetical protein
MSTYQPLEKRNYENQQLPCVNCRTPRHGVSKFCGNCKLKYYTYGSPTVIAIKRDEYKEEKRIVEELVGINEDKESIRVALIFFQNLLDHSEEKKFYLKGQDLLEIYNKLGVTPKQLLIESLAIFAYCHSSGRFSWRSITYALGRSIIRIVKKFRRRSYGNDYFGIGNHVLIKLKPLYLTVSRLVIKYKESERELIDSLNSEELEPLCRPSESS